MNGLKRLCGVAAVFIPLASLASAQWTKIANPGFTFGAGQALLLTDGSVLVHDESAAAKGTIGSDWKRLIPDAFGSYTNGSWVNAGSLQAGYGPLYFASAVLADGRVVVIGGEYNLADNGGNAVETNQGAIYNPATNLWSPLPGPGWGKIGDAPSCVLPNGDFMVGYLFGTQTAELDSSLTWSAVGSGKADNNAEEGWSLLPDGTMLTVDCQNGNHAEKFVVGSGNWISAGNTIDHLPAGAAGFVSEIGPSVLRPDGTVVVFGASGFNDVYTPPVNPLDPGTWAAGPSFPNPYDVADGPGCLLPSGNVLIAASPGIYNSPTHFYEFDGVNLNAVAATPNSPSLSSFQGRMLLLPTGQVLFTDGSNDVEIYTPGGAFNNAWRPTLSSPPAFVGLNHSYTISGTQFNGLSQAVAYGDDGAAATNYPLVRIRNNGTGHVFYCKTHDHSTMAVATGGTPVSTTFDVPGSVELGASTLEVVANGIPSVAAAITVLSDTTPPTTTALLSGPAGTNGWYTGTVTVTLSATDPDGVGDVAATYYTVDGGGPQTYSGPVAVSGDLVHSVTFWSVDRVGNTEAANPLTIKIDGTKPALTFGALSPLANGFGWNNTAVDIGYTTADNVSGVNSATPGSPLHFSAEGAGQTQTVTVTDNAGNTATFTSPVVNIDLTAPVTTSSLSGPAGNHGWFRGAVQVTLGATDNLSGVYQTFYSIDGGATRTYSGSAFTVSGDLIHSVSYWSVDKAGNVETANTITIKIDSTPPVITVSANPSTLWPSNNKMVAVTVSGSITDNLSGVDPSTTMFAVVDKYGLIQPTGPITLNPDGTYSFVIMLEARRLGADKSGRTYTITVLASDMAGNPASASTVVVVPHDQG